MARGIEVLQAAADGKRIRTDNGLWMDFGWLKSNWRIGALWDNEWVIEEPTMTFAEAVTALDAGQIVSRQERRYRKHPTKGNAYQLGLKGWEMGDAPGTSKWVWNPSGSPDAEVYFSGEDLHATDWRVVTERENETHLPSQSEAISMLINVPTLRDELGIPVSRVGSRSAREIIKGLAKEYPAMFRKEDEE